METRALRLTVFLRQGDLFRHRPAYAELVLRARKAGLAGATVLRGCEGLGATRRISSEHPSGIGERVPYVVIIVDTPERITEFLPQVRELHISGLVMLAETLVVNI